GRPAGGQARPGRAGRPRRQRRPPRPQARQRPARRPRRAEGQRLRPGEAARQRRRADARRRRVGHAGVHGPRAGRRRQGGAGRGLAPLALWRLDPDREPRRIEAELAAGREVVLVDEGPPRWHRWVVGEEGAKFDRAEDGAFTAVAWTFGMLQLARLGGDRYRL